jgi:bla regulator protein blaR1
MMTRFLSAMWTTMIPALGNHLWQSTLFAAVAGALAFALRKYHARIRYWLWLAASAKFLIPFSLLAAMGSHLVWLHFRAGTSTGAFLVMEEAGQPFAQPLMHTFSPMPSSVSPASLAPLLPAFLAAVWLCGFLVVLVAWYLRWLRLWATLRNAMPLRKGREVETLRRLESIAGLRKPIEVRLSGASLEPAIFGIARPTLVWPEGLSERLEDAHIEAVLAHELRHVRRRDNLAAAIHMVVEAVFWFHPLVWWMGARLVEERERACDEEALELGNERQVYAESILKICKFCVESRLACVSGVTGADLKKRIVRIMTGRATLKLDFGRKLLLSAAGLLAVAAPIVLGQVRATQNQPASQDQGTAAISPAPVFEVASVKLDRPGDRDAATRLTSGGAAIRLTSDRLVITNFTLHALIRTAYMLQDGYISGEPTWLGTERYDIDAKVDPDQLNKLAPGQRKVQIMHMLQALLADRFKLTVHHETKELPIYALVIANGGPKVKEAKPGDTYPNGPTGPGGRPIGGGTLVEPERGKLVGQGVPIANLVQLLSRYPELDGRVVLDRSGLAGEYDFTLQWTPENAMLNGGMTGSDNNASSSDSSPSLFTAIQEQLGLKLESTKGPVDTLVIDHVEHPSKN